MKWLLFILIGVAVVYIVSGQKDEGSGFKSPETDLDTCAKEKQRLQKKHDDMPMIKMRSRRLLRRRIQDLPC